MIKNQDLSQGQMALSIAGFEANLFQVIRYRGTEGLCQLYRFEIDLVTSDVLESLDAFLRKLAVFGINTSHGARWFHGMISRVEFLDESVGQTFLRAELAPMIWLLTHR